MSALPRDRTNANRARDATVTACDLGQISTRVARTLLVAPELVEGALRDGRRAGYEDGYSSGYADGLAEARIDAAGLADQLSGLVPKLQDVATAQDTREAIRETDIEDLVVSVAFGSRRNSSVTSLPAPRSQAAIH